MHGFAPDPYSAALTAAERARDEATSVAFSRIQWELDQVVPDISRQVIRGIRAEMQALIAAEVALQIKEWKLEKES